MKSHLRKTSPLPVVDLTEIGMPTDGIHVKIPGPCRKNYAKGKCEEHYQRLANSEPLDNSFVQCPYGFCSFPVRTKSRHFALTSIVPYPREGGSRESQNARNHKECKIARVEVEVIARELKLAIEEIAKMESEMVKRNSMSLHELRKFNRTIKQTAERRCRVEEPDNPSAADPELVKIWKAAEFMSTHFEIIELIADETLTDLPANHRVSMYRLVDKVVHLYKDRRIDVDVSLSASPPGFGGDVFVCDRTIHMIPTVLIDNAIKYASRGSKVYVEISQEEGKCKFSVTNAFKSSIQLGRDIFEKGVRHSEIDGTGFGLYLAHLIAKQHKSKIEFQQSAEWITFWVDIPE